MDMPITRVELQRRRAANLCRDCGQALPPDRVRYCIPCCEKVIEADEGD